MASRRSTSGKRGSPVRYEPALLLVAGIAYGLGCGGKKAGTAPVNAAAGASAASGASPSTAGAAGNGGSVAGSAGSASGSSGSGGSSAGGDAGSATAGSAGMSTIIPSSRPVCGGPVDPGSQSQGCPVAKQIQLSSPKVSSGDGGVLGPGSQGIVQVTLTNSTSQGLSLPCVGFVADNPAVTFLGGQNPVQDSHFSLTPGASINVSIAVQVSSSLPSGTDVRLGAWVDCLNCGCMDGTSLVWSEKL